MEIDALQLTALHLDLIMEFIATYLIQRLIFLERGFYSKKKQALYYVASLLLIFGVAYFGGEYAGALVLLVTEGANMSLARLERLKKKYPDVNICRINAFIDKQYAREKLMCGLVFPMAIPVLGVATGLVIPILYTPSIIFGMSESFEAWYRLIIFFTVSFGCIVYLIISRSWRKKFAAGIGSTGLKSWEHSLLCVAGCLSLFASLLLMQPAGSASGIFSDDGAFVYNRTLAVLGAMTFTLTVSVVILTIINNQRSYLNGRVSDMQRSVISVMADIVENRDENTGGHIKRTAKYVEIIAKELRREDMFPEILTDAYVKDMVVAAPLHDVGKIHVSDTILNKPGKLTDEEFEEMKTHTSEGKKLLQHAREQIGDFDYLNIAIDMAGYHHEWWDGSAKGYPEHISGEDIPLCARIMAVADVFDALISRRCYKAAMPLSKAYSIIKEESGTHFDPAVVEAFFIGKDEIEAALTEFNLAEAESEEQMLLKKEIS